MTPSFIKKSAFRAVGKSIEVSMDNLQLCGTLWEECEKDGTAQQLFSLAKGKPLYGVNYGYTESGDFLYMAGAESAALAGGGRGEEASLPEGWSEVLIPAAEYAVFSVKGEMPRAIGETFAYIYGEYFPKSSRKPALSPALEVYGMDGDKLLCDVWIPLL